MSQSCHIAGCNNSICHIENRFSPYFIFFNAVWALTSGSFVASPIHLFNSQLTVLKKFNWLRTSCMVSITTVSWRWRLHWGSLSWSNQIQSSHSNLTTWAHQSWSCSTALVQTINNEWH